MGATGRCSGCRKARTAEGPPACRLHRAQPRRGRCLLCRGDRRRRQGQWRAGPAAALSPELLRRLRLRSRRQQCRSRLPWPGVSETDEPRQPADLYRRLPVRRGALPRRGRAGRRLDLPLPHVPEGLRQFLSAAGLGARRQARLDARRAEMFPLVQSCRARLLRRLRHAADLRGAGRHRRWRSARSTIRRTSRR